MSLKVIGGYLAPNSSEFRQAEEFCSRNSLTLTLEWQEGQYWLHSPEEKERPIGIEIDRELQRHEEFFKQSSLTKELLARAIGIKSGFRPSVLDLTAGMLGDSLLFLSFGCQVTALERHPVIALLIESAIKNASHPALSRLQFFHQDAASYLAHKAAVDVIYFDPMFEDSNEKSLPKKEMRIFREFVGSDKDALSVFALGREHKPKRLVVKRPRLSVVLSEKPDIEFTGKATRYDVYLPQTR